MNEPDYTILDKAAQSVLGKKTKKSLTNDDVPGIVDDELRNLGWSPNARLSLLGNLGRENSWNLNTIFAGHDDPDNKKYNRGIISWQGNRQTDLQNYMQSNGGDFSPNESNIRLMTRFMDHEMQNSRDLRVKKWRVANQSLKNPNISLPEASKHLTDYIAYEFTDPKTGIVFNTRDSEYGSVNNRKWGEKAKKRGLGASPDYSQLDRRNQTADFSSLDNIAQQVLGKTSELPGELYPTPADTKTDLRTGEITFKEPTDGTVLIQKNDLPVTSPTPTFPQNVAPLSENKPLAPRTFTKREIKPGESFYAFERDGKSGDNEYLGIAEGRHYFKNTDGDELVFDEQAKELKPTGQTKRAFDGDKNEYLLSDDQKNLQAGEIRRTRNDKNYIFQPDNKIREENPVKIFTDGSIIDEERSGLSKDYVRLIDPTTKEQKGFYKRTEKDGKESFQTLGTVKVKGKTYTESTDQENLRNGQMRFTESETGDELLLNKSVDKTGKEVLTLPQAARKERIQAGVNPSPNAQTQTETFALEPDDAPAPRVFDAQELTLGNNTKISRAANQEGLNAGEFRFTDADGETYIVNGQTGQIKDESLNKIVDQFRYAKIPHFQKLSTPIEAARSSAAGQVAQQISEKYPEVNREDAFQFLMKYGFTVDKSGNPLPESEKTRPFYQTEEQHRQSLQTGYKQTAAGQPNAENKNDTSDTNYLSRRNLLDLTLFSKEQQKLREDEVIKQIASGQTPDAAFLDKFGIKLEDLDRNRRDEYQMALTKGKVSREDFERFKNDFVKSGQDAYEAKINASRRMAWIKPGEAEKELTAYREIKNQKSFEETGKTLSPFVQVGDGSLQNLAPARKAAEFQTQAYLDKMLSRYGSATKILEKRENAAREEAARQERLKNMGWTEYAAESAKAVPFNIAKGAISTGLSATLQGAVTWTKPVADYIDSVFGTKANYQDIRKHPFYKAGLEIDEFLNDTLKTNKDFDSEFFQGTVPKAIGSSIGMIFPSLSNKPKIAIALFSTLQMSGASYEEAIKAGASDEDAQKFALLNGGLFGWTEIVGVGNALQRLNSGAGGNVWRRLFQQSLRDSGKETFEEVFLNEGVQTVGGNYLASITYDPDRKLDEGLAESLLAAGFSAGMVSTGVTILNTVRNQRQINKIIQEDNANGGAVVRNFGESGFYVYGKETPINEQMKPFVEQHTKLQKEISDAFGDLNQVKEKTVGSSPDQVLRFARQGREITAEINRLTVEQEKISQQIAAVSGIQKPDILEQVVESEAKPEQTETPPETVARSVASESAPAELPEETPNISSLVGQTVNLKNKGQGVIVEERDGGKYLVDYNNGNSRALFRENQFEFAEKNDVGPNAVIESEPESQAAPEIIQDSADDIERKMREMGMLRDDAQSPAPEVVGENTANNEAILAPTKPLKTTLETGDKFTIGESKDVFEVQPRGQYQNKNFEKIKNLSTGEVFEQPFKPSAIAKLNFVKTDGNSKQTLLTEIEQSPNKLEKVKARLKSKYFNAPGEIEGAAQENDSQLLFRARTAEAESELSNVQKSAFSPQIIEKATVKRTNSGTELNAAGIELLRRAFINAGFSAKTFDGVFLEPEQLEKTQNELRELAQDLTDIGEKSAAEKVRNISEALSNNAAENETAIAYIFDDAVPHEMFHRAGYVAAINKSLELRHGANLDKLFDLPAVQKAYQNYFSRQGYAADQRGVLVEETADYLATGDREKLGLTEEEADKFLLDWARSFAEANGIESLEKFREISEDFDKVIQQVKNNYEQRQQPAAERQRSGVQRGNQSESDRGRTIGNDTRGATERRSEPESGTRQAEGNERESVKAVTGETDDQIKQKNRKFAESLADVGISIGGVLYNPQTEKNWLKGASDTIEKNLASGKGIDGAIEDYEKLDARTSEGNKTALGKAIITHLYIASDREKLRTFGRELTKDIGNYAQELRATQLLSRFDPEFAPIYAGSLKERHRKIPLTAEEEQEVLNLARTFSDVADARVLAEAASDEHQEYKARLENEQKSLEAALKSAEKSSPKTKPETDKRIKKVQEQTADYKAEKPKSSKKDVAKEISSKKTELLKRIRQEFGGNPLLMVNSPLLMAANNQAFEALIELGALKLIEELPKGFTLKQFDDYINFLSRNKLSAEQVVEIHAQAYQIARGEKTPLSDEAKLRQKNRYEHAKRANSFLNADEIAAKREAKDKEIAERRAEKERKAEQKRIDREKQIEADRLTKEVEQTEKRAAREIERAEKEAAREQEKAERAAARESEQEYQKEVKEQTDDALRNKTAYRRDKYSRKIVNIAKAFNLDEKTVFAAMGIREIGNRFVVAESMRNTYPGISKSEIATAFVSAVELRRQASEEISKEIADRKAGYELTEAEYQKIQNQIKTARIAERKARKALELYYKQLTRSTGAKIVDNALDVYNLVRGLAYSMDLGFILRQGGIPMLANTKAWKESLKGIKPAFQSEEKFDSFVDNFYNDVRRKTLESYGAEFETIGDEISFSEEFLSRFTGKIPGIKHTNRAHSLTTDLFRFNVGNQVFAEIDRMNLDPEQKERAKEFLAKKWVNLITGKGYIGNAFGVGSTSSKAISTIFGAPRFAVAGFQFIYYTNPVRMAFLPKGARKIVAKAALRTYTPLAMMAAALGALGLMNLDPEDKDFLVINGNRIAELTGIESFKNQYFDFLGGKKEPLRLVYGLPLKMMFYALTDNPEGYKRIWKSLKAEFFGTDERFSPYLRGKLNPALSIGFNLWEGEDITGQPYGWSDVPADLFLPILLREIAGAASYDKKKNILHTQSKLEWKSENAGRILTTLVLSFLGVGVGNYPKRETTTAYKQALSQNNFREDEYESEEKQKRRQIKAALKRLVRENEDVSEEIEKYLADGTITEDDAEAIKNAKKTLPIEDLLKTADEAAIYRVLKFASRKENWLNDRIDEAEAERAILERLLLTKRETKAEKEEEERFNKLKKQVRSGGLPFEEAETVLIQQLENAEITNTQFKRRRDILLMSKVEEEVSNLDVSKNSDFRKIETFIKNLEPDDREPVYLQLLEKAKNKFDDESEKSIQEGERLLKIVEENFSDLDKAPDEKPKETGKSQIRPFTREEIDPRFELPVNWQYGSLTDDIINDAGATPTKLGTYRESQNVEDQRPGQETPFDKRKREFIDWLTKPSAPITPREDTPEIKEAKERAKREYEEVLRLEREKAENSFSLESQTKRIKEANDSQSVIEIFENADREQQPALLPELQRKSKNARSLRERQAYKKAISQYLDEVESAAELERQGVRVSW